MAGLGRLITEMSSLAWTATMFAWLATSSVSCSDVPSKQVALTSTKPAGVNEYWISPGGNDHNSGSEGQSWATFAHADAELQLGPKGTIVHVAPGTYNECILTTKKGAPDRRITYLSDTQYGAHLVCVAGNSEKNQEAIWNARGSYTDIVGFDIDGQLVQKQSRIGIYLNYDLQGNPTGYNRVLGNKIHGLERCGSSASPTGTTEFTASSPHNTYDGNVVYSIGNTCQTQGFAAGVSGQGVYISNPYDIVTNNIFYDIGYANASSPGYAIWSNHQGASNDFIANNLMFENGAGVVLGWQTDPSLPATRYTMPGLDNMTITNNIIVHNKGWGIAEYDYGCLYSGGACAAGNFGPNSRYDNNLLYGNGGAKHGAFGKCPVVGDSPYNIVVFHGRCASKSVNVDPAFGAVFVNWQMNGLGDYHLKQRSPAIGAGENSSDAAGLAIPATDLFGGTRPAGAKVDIGPHQYGSEPQAYPWWLRQ